MTNMRIKQEVNDIIDELPVGSKFTTSEIIANMIGTRNASAQKVSMIIKQRHDVENTTPPKVIAIWKKI